MMMILALISYCCTFTGLDGSRIVEKNFKYWLNLLEGYLDRKIPHQMTDRRRTSRSLQFKYDLDGSNRLGVAGAYPHLIRQED